MALQAKYEITMASGRDYISDWMPVPDARDDHAWMVREGLLEAVNSAGGRGLLTFPRHGEKVGINLAHVEFVEIRVEVKR